MFCKQCGHKIADDALKCASCGAKFGKGNRFCIFCGEKKENGTDNCPNCGHSYTEFVKRSAPEPLDQGNVEKTVAPQAESKPIQETKKEQPVIPDFGGNASLQKIFANVNAQGIEEDMLLQELSKQQQPKPSPPQNKPDPVKAQSPRKPITTVVVPEPPKQPEMVADKAAQQDIAPEETVMSGTEGLPELTKETPDSPAAPNAQMERAQSKPPVHTEPQTQPLATKPTIHENTAQKVEPKTPIAVNQTQPVQQSQSPQGTVPNTPGFWQGVGIPPAPEKQMPPMAYPNTGAVANMRQAHQDAAKNNPRVFPDSLALLGAMLSMATALATGDRCLFLGIAAIVASLIGLSSKRLRFVAIAGIFTAIIAMIVAWITKDLTFITMCNPVN